MLRRLKIAMMLCTSFLIVEVVGGYLSGSLGVLSDAAHLFADLAGFAVAYAASHLASLPPTQSHTFGLKRTESLAALLSMISLALVSVYLAVEAIRRLYMLVIPRIISSMRDEDGTTAATTTTTSSLDVDGRLMTEIAAIGILVNLALAWVLGVENHIHLPGADHNHSHDHGHGEDCHDHHHVEHQTVDNHHEHQHHDHDSGHQCEHHDHSHNKVETNPYEGHSHEHDTDNKKEDDIESSLVVAATTTESMPLIGEQQDGKSMQQRQQHNYETVHPALVAQTGTVVQEEHRKQQQQQGLVQNNVNLQAAYLHVMGDLLQSIGVFLTGLVIWYNPAWAWVDPIITLFFCVMVFISTLSVLRHSVAVLLQQVPPDMSWQAIYQAIEHVQGVHNVHDLHIWSISHGMPALTVHCSCDGDPQVALQRISTVLQQEMGIHHVTIQIVEGQTRDCITCKDSGCMDPSSSIPSVGVYCSGHHNSK